MLVLALLLGCGPAAAPVHAVAPADAFARIEATLNEAVRLDHAGQPDEARAAWRRAHAGWERELSGFVATAHGARAALATDYAFGLLRHEIDSPDGDAQSAAEALVRSIEARIAKEVSAGLGEPAVDAM